MEDSITELVGEMLFKHRIKNPDINFSAIAVGKWGNIQDCYQLDSRLDNVIIGLMFFTTMVFIQLKSFFGTVSDLIYT